MPFILRMSPDVHALIFKQLGTEPRIRTRLELPKNTPPSACVPFPAPINWLFFSIGKLFMILINQYDSFQEEEQHDFSGI
jgi:hypothetical protein